MFFLAGCDTQRTDEGELDRFEEAIKKAENSPSVETELFLGFKIGMSKTEYITHADSLNAIGKIAKDDTWGNLYWYDLRLSNESTIHIQIIPRFERDSLYAVEYFFIEKGSNAGTTNGMTAMMGLFRGSERGKNFRRYTDLGVLYETHYHIKNNLVVKFYSYDNVSRMVYEDAPTVKILKQRELEENDSIYNRAKEDLF